MAGDLDLNEEVVVLQTSADEVGAQAAQSVEKAGERVLHRFGPRVMVMEVSEKSEDNILKSLRGASFAPSPSRLSAATRKEMDTTGMLGYEALRLRQKSAFRQAKAQRPLASEVWDTASAQRPDAVDVDDPLDVRESLAMGDVPAPSPTSSFLIGSIAVGLIIVEGPTDDLKFDESERAKVVAEVQNGLSWLGTQEPRANVSWSYDIKIVTLSTPPGSAGLSLSEKERLWRDPAMDQLGYGPGISRVRSYVQDLRSQLHTRWGYCAFFTKYPVGHFAYAKLKGPRLVMHYENDNWGVDNIDRVYAHETGHIFGAPDEYASSGCSCGGEWGYLRTPNGNCVNCAEGGGVSCIMRSNEWAMCDYTRTHFGWRDQDGDDVLDPDDIIENPRWWLYRWLCRRYPGLCQFLRIPHAEQEEDLIPMSLLAQELSAEDLERLATRIDQEKSLYLDAIAERIEEASEELRSVIR